MYSQVMYWGVLAFIFMPIFEVAGHFFLAGYKRNGTCADQSVQELLGHENYGVVIAAIFILSARALLLTSMAMMAWAFFFLSNTNG